MKKSEEPTYQPPQRQFLFAAKGEFVYRGQRKVCRADSGTMARRIAAALNVYQPGPRGF